MKIFIDAGHNDSKFDTGAIGNGLREQDITFAISTLLAERLKDVGVDVKLSREKKDSIIGYDFNSSLAQRTEMANVWGADLFISIHCNSFVNARISGTEAYTYSDTTDVYKLSRNICNAISQNLKLVNRGAKISNFAVLKKTAMPAILIETAFISNAEDANKLTNKQEKFAETIFAELADFYNLKGGDFEAAVNILSAKGIIGEPQKWKSKEWDAEDVAWLIKKTAQRIGG